MLFMKASIKEIKHPIFKGYHEIMIPDFLILIACIYLITYTYICAASESWEKNVYIFSLEAFPLHF